MCVYVCVYPVVRTHIRTHVDWGFLVAVYHDEERKKRKHLGFFYEYLRQLNLNRGHYHNHNDVGDDDEE